MLYKKLMVVIFIITLLTSVFIKTDQGYAQEENPDNSLTKKLETLISTEDEGSIKEKVGEILPKEGSKFDFKEIDTEKIVQKTQVTGDQLYLIAQAYSWPMFMWSIILGIGCLFIGGVFGSSWLKKAGGFFLFMAALRVVIINYAPEIVSVIVNWIEGLKGG